MRHFKICDKCIKAKKTHTAGLQWIQDRHLNFREREAKKRRRSRNSPTEYAGFTTIVGDMHRCPPPTSKGGGKFRVVEKLVSWKFIYGILLNYFEISRILPENSQRTVSMSIFWGIRTDIKKKNIRNGAWRHRPSSSGPSRVRRCSAEGWLCCLSESHPTLFRQKGYNACGVGVVSGLYFGKVDRSCFVQIPSLQATPHEDHEHRCVWTVCKDHSVWQSMTSKKKAQIRSILICLFPGIAKFNIFHFYISYIFFLATRITIFLKLWHVSGRTLHPKHRGCFVEGDVVLPHPWNVPGQSVPSPMGPVFGREVCDGKPSKSDKRGWGPFSRALIHNRDFRGIKNSAQNPFPPPDSPLSRRKTSPAFNMHPMFLIISPLVFFPTAKHYANQFLPHDAKSRIYATSDGRMFTTPGSSSRQSLIFPDTCTAAHPAASLRAALTVWFRIISLFL